MGHLYTPKAEPKELRVTFTVRLTPEQAKHVKLMADAWNAADKAAGVRRSRKWKSSSVVARLITVGIDDFFDGVKLPPPANDTERAAFIAHCVKVLTGLSGSPQKKK